MLLHLSNNLTKLFHNEGAFGVAELPLGYNIRTLVVVLPILDLMEVGGELGFSEPQLGDELFLHIIFELGGID
jgi:hypothetical protein